MKLIHLSPAWIKYFISLGNGRNTESFDPRSSLVRPDFRIQFGSNKAEAYGRKLRHDDVVVIPEFFSGEDDWNIYYKLVEEMEGAQRAEKEEDVKEVEGGGGKKRRRRGRGRGRGRRRRRRRK